MPTEDGYANRIGIILPAESLVDLSGNIGLSRVDDATIADLWRPLP
ncbi:MAG: hypothetical protein O7F17_11060 [Planctomycetota bacterium]|nr:hypothetical protein [Planctomycetota bacterium]